MESQQKHYFCQSSNTITIYGNLFQYEAMLRSLGDEKCVVVMDNAAYHGRTVNKLPKLYMKKAEIVQFMKDHDINGWDQGTKQQLLDKINARSQVIVTCNNQ